MIPPDARYQAVVLYFSTVHGGVGGLKAILEDGTRHDVNFNNFVLPPVGSDQRQTLEALQTVYASADGFRDADFTRVLPEIHEYPYGATPESLSDHGYWNPLDADDYTRFQNRMLMQSRLNAGNNAERALAAWVMNFGLKFGTVEVAGTVTQNLGELFDAVLVNTGSFELRLYFDIDDRVNYVNINQQIGFKAMLTWLESIRQGGAPIVMDGYTDDISMFAAVFGRSFTDDEGSFTLACNVSGIGLTPELRDGSYYLTELSYIFSASATVNSTYINNVDNLLAARDIEVSGIPGVSTISVKPPVDLPPFRLGSTEFFNIGKTVAIRVSGPLDEPYVIPLTGRFGVTFPWDELEGAGTERTFTRNRVVDTVHVGEIYNSRLILPPARELVQNNGEYRIIAIHNTGADGDGYCQVQGGPDAAGLYSETEEFLRAYPQEELEFRIGLTREGKEEVVALKPPDRHLQLDVNAASFPALTDFTEFDWAQGGATNRVFLIHYAQTVAIDADAFDLGSGTPPTGTPDFETGVTDWDILGTVEILLDGVLNVNADFGLRLTASGGIGRWSGIRIYLIRGTTLIELDNVPYEELTGNNSSRFYRARRRYRVRKGDRIGVFFRDRGGSDTTIALSDVELEGGKLDMWLEPRLVRT